MKWKKIFFVLTENKLIHWNEINKELDKNIMKVKKN